MNVKSMRDPRIILSILLLGTLCFQPICAQIDSDALLLKARAKVVESVAKLPKYTCVQTVRRSRFDPFYGSRKKGCNHIEEDPGKRQSVWLAWTDQLRLDVTISDGAEIFSWAGAREFQSSDARDIAGNGLTSTGDFGHFLMTIFGNNSSAAFQSLGAERDRGQSLAVYQYRVPALSSQYEIRLSSRRGDVATLAYEGKFWVDSENAELRRMTIVVPHTPARSETCRIDTDIEYRRVPMAGSQLLLPQLTLLKLWDNDGSRYENRTTYSACRAFQSESVLRTDSEPTAAPTVANSAPESSFSIPPGIVVRIALLSPINGESSFAGDAIEGEITEPLRSGDGKILAPQGALVRGRIVRLEQNLQPSRYFTLGLRFDTLRVDGHEHPLHLEVITRPGNAFILAGANEKREGTGLFVFSTDALVVNQGFVSEWTTAK
jgi:hypothetical protein